MAASASLVTLDAGISERVCLFVDTVAPYYKACVMLNVGFELKLNTSRQVVMLFYVESVTVFVAIISLLICLDIVAVVTRLYTRRVTHQRLETDDWLVIPALVCSLSILVDYTNAHRYSILA